MARRILLGAALVLCGSIGIAVLLRPAPPGDHLDGLVLPETGPLAITAFGTSLTAASPWPDLLAQHLERCLGRSVILTRVAAPGMGSAWGVEQLPRVVATAPDLVLIEFAINDADLRDGVSRARARAQHRTILRRLGTARPEAQRVLMTMSPAHGPRGWSRPFLAWHYADLAPLAQAEGAALVDLYGRWLALPRSAARAPDGLHPGPDMVARTVVPALAETLGRAANARC